jgi:hypothetical protein
VHAEAECWLSKCRAERTTLVFGRRKVMRLGLIFLGLMLASPALAAEGFDGRGLSLWWALPFAGLLLCIATGPVLYHRTWEHHYGKITALWALLIIAPLVLFKGAWRSRPCSIRCCSNI